MRRRLLSPRGEESSSRSPPTSTQNVLPSTDPLHTAFVPLVCLFLIVFTTITVIFVLILRYHRIDTLTAIQGVLDVASRPILEHSLRCRAYSNSSSLRFRCLPNTFFIGASKCATTSLVSYLRNISDVHFVSRRVHARDHHSEVHRFDRSNFPISFQRLELLEEWASSPLIEDILSPVIHYTPHYIYAPMVPFEIRRFYPISKPITRTYSLRRDDLKFIVLLRDPVARAFSSYWFKKSHLFRENGFVDTGSLEDFDALVDREISMRVEYDACMDEHYFSKMLSGKPFFDLNKQDFSNLLEIGVDEDLYSMLKQSLESCFGPKMVRSSKLGLRHVDKGIYVDQLYRWFINFNSQNVIIEAIESWSDEIVQNNSFLSSFQRVLRFINVRNDVVEKVEQQHSRDLYAPNEIWRNFSAILDDVKYTEKSSAIFDGSDEQKKAIQLYMRIKKKLSDFYRPYNRLLVTMLQAVAGESNGQFLNFCRIALQGKWCSNN